MTEEEILLSANRLIEMYGSEALSYAVTRARQLEREGDFIGVEVMAQIVVTIRLLQQRESPSTELH